MVQWDLLGLWGLWEAGLSPAEHFAEGVVGNLQASLKLILILISMKYVNSGNGKLPLITLIAILSISLTVNLPGLAISPIMAQLKDTLHATELESQLLTVLPNLVIIPFILLSGRICTPKNQLLILSIGLAIFALTGVLCFFADSMIQLILLSCFIGVGCGLVIPLAASLISQFFTGAARVKQLGHKSGISNFMIIIATMFVGWIAALDWHYSFIVYMVPIIPLCLVPFMSTSYVDKYKQPGNNGVLEPRQEPKVQPKPAVKVTAPTGPNFHFSGNQSLKLLFGIIGLYIAVTYGSMVVSYYMPFTMDHYHMTTGEVGTATSLFYAAATVAGFLLTPFIKYVGKNALLAGILMIMLGLYVMGFFHAYITFVIGTVVLGFGYGIIQPVIYDKTTYVAPNAAASTQYFSYVLTANYIAIAIVPFIIDFMERGFGSDSVNFSFIFNGSFMAAVLIYAYFRRKNFVFKVNPELYKN